ncbi:hypothetical protein SO078_24595 (plasmid) [Sinorhizobium meliloti]|uniref:hypothetical protein n=1 Tax=Rhizobium meliloti TaxID=382 RepID=UPI002D764B79|nr:hypothetical protein [Sinorhizobium meliloti]WRQ70048.1 hypothetical protein SO078_24595 [Sinorhizobium meliloti]
MLKRTTFPPGIKSSVRPSHDRVTALASVASIYSPPSSPPGKWKVLRSSLPDKPMKKDENIVSKNPAPIHRVLSRMKRRLSRAKSKMVSL